MTYRSKVRKYSYQHIFKVRTFSRKLFLFLFCSAVLNLGECIRQIPGTRADSSSALHRHQRRQTSIAKNFDTYFSSFDKGDLRSSRHRREPNADVLGSESNFRRIAAPDQVQNGYKPTFETCDSYKPRVKEESIKGKFFHLTKGVEGLRLG